MFEPITTGPGGVLPAILGYRKMNEVEFRKCQEELARNADAGVYTELAKMRKIQYDAYVKIGFTEQQALELIKAEISRPMEKKG